MKKPINKFALGLWILAALYVIGEVWGWYYFANMDAQLAGFSHTNRPPLLLDSPINLAMNAAILASLGMLIEIGDKIRWLLERRPNDYRG